MFQHLGYVFSYIGDTFLMGSPAPIMQNPLAFENNPVMSPVAMRTPTDAFVPAPPMHVSPSYQHAARFVLNFLNFILHKTFKLKLFPTCQTWILLKDSIIPNLGLME